MLRSILPSAFTADASAARAERGRGAGAQSPTAPSGFEDREGIHAVLGSSRAGRCAHLRTQPQRGGVRGIGQPDGLPVGAALVIARQMADALEAAHERGIVHRDLKPANIILQGTRTSPSSVDSSSRSRDEVVVKVVDFGLAKVEATEAVHDPSLSPTVTVGGLSEGVVLGTAAYMSPEQARGRSVDKRTDIWAFGCVLFEMLTGRNPFGGDTVSDTIAGILEREPDWRLLPEATPATIRRLLQRCLEKDLKRRLHDIADARLEIDDASSASGTAWTPAEAKDARPTSRTPWVVAGLLALLVIIAVAAIVTLWPGRGASSRPPLARVTIALPPGQTLEKGRFPPIALSPTRPAAGVPRRSVADERNCTCGQSTISPLEPSLRPRARRPRSSRATVDGWAFTQTARSRKCRWRAEYR